MNPRLEHILCHLRANRKLGITGYQIKPNNEKTGLKAPLESDVENRCSRKHRHLLSD